MPYLEIRTSQGRKRIAIEGLVSMGRHPENTLILRDDQASRRHCVIEPHNGGFRVRDLGSRNGTRLNDEKVAEEMLDNGDIVRIGATEVHFIDPEQVGSHRRPVTPDFAAAMDDIPVPRPQEQATLDLDLNDVVTQVQTDYEKRLQEIIDAAPEKPFDADDISLVDTRGVTVHQAAGTGLKSNTDDEGAEGIRAFRQILLAAFRARSTDIHVEPRLDDAAIRFRVDGYMLSAVEISQTLQRRIIAVVKILCHIDTTQRNAVQDGHFSSQIKGRRVDFRVSLTPAVNGQKLVIRVLDSANAPSRLHELGLVPWMYEKLREIAIKDAGLLLVCGPTGSGKTTTLYSCLREIDVNTRNAITIEDPVEYYLEGCTQIPIDHKQGNTFANILRSVLRQDPDVIFVGEIRDLETANVAMQASMTGHLVYSTVHSKDTIGAVFRLLDLGVEPYLVANAMNVILAQRLIRTLCPTCRKAVKPTPTQNMKMGRSLDGVPEMYVPAGCRRCLRTGFIGRRAIFELLQFNEQLRDTVLKTPTIQQMREIAGQGLFATLQQSGYQLVAQGATAIDEIDRVAGTG